MKCVLIALAAVAVVAGAGLRTADAQRKGPTPWCIENGSFGDSAPDCTYWTYEQCRASARGAGGVCVENPILAWGRRGQPQDRRYPRR
jgi:hypothetical protein